MGIGTWHNADGLEVRFQDYWRDPGNFVNKARAVSTLGTTKQLVIDYDLTRIAAGTTSFTSDLNNDGTVDGFNTGDIYLPAYSSVREAVLYVSEAAAGGTSIKLGIFGLDGTVVDDDFLITATEGVKANIDSIGSRTFGAGVGVATTAETASVGSADAYLALTVAGTFTAGKGKIVINYVDILGDS
jgi:hypothetical protein